MIQTRGYSDCRWTLTVTATINNEHCQLQHRVSFQGLYLDSGAKQTEDPNRRRDKVLHFTVLNDTLAKTIL